MRARAAAVATGEAALQSPLKSPAVSQNARVYMCMCTCACACVHTHVRRGGGGSVRASIVRHMPTHSYVLACAPCAHMPRGVTLCVLDQLPPRAHAHCAIVRISQCAMSTPVRHCCCPVAGSQPPRRHGVCVCVCVCVCLSVCARLIGALSLYETVTAMGWCGIYEWMHAHGNADTSAPLKPVPLHTATKPTCRSAERRSTHASTSLHSRTRASSSSVCTQP